MRDRHRACDERYELTAAQPVSHLPSLCPCPRRPLPPSYATTRPGTSTVLYDTPFSHPHERHHCFCGSPSLVGGGKTILTIKANNISRKAIQAFAVNATLHMATLDPAKDGQPVPQCQTSGISDDSKSVFGTLARGLLGFSDGIEPRFALS